MRWEVQLTGDPTDLQMLADACAGGQVQVAQSDEEYVLRSIKFEHLDSTASVRRSAVRLVTALSALARLMLGTRGAIGVDAVYRVRLDGKRDITVLVEPAVSHERALPITVVHGTKIQDRPIPSRSGFRWLRMAQSSLEPCDCEMLTTLTGLTCTGFTK